MSHVESRYLEPVTSKSLPPNYFLKAVTSKTARRRWGGMPRMPRNRRRSWCQGQTGLLLPIYLCAGSRAGLGTCVDRQPTELPLLGTWISSARPHGHTRIYIVVLTLSGERATSRRFSASSPPRATTNPIHTHPPTSPGPLPPPCPPLQVWVTA